MAESVLSKQLDALERTLAGNGYRVKDLADQFGTKPTEIRAVFRDQLLREKAKSLHEEMLAAGLPV